MFMAGRLADGRSFAIRDSLWRPPPYAYYFLAEAHADAGHWALARSFVARAQQLFAADPYWLGRVHALHGRIAEEEGRLDEARDAYTRALAAWPRNGDAANALARLDASGQGAR